MAQHEESRPHEAPLPEKDAAGDVLRMLLVEDSEDDALLLLHELRRLNRHLERKSGPTAASGEPDWEMMGLDPEVSGGGG